MTKAEDEIQSPSKRILERELWGPPCWGVFTPSLTLTVTISFPWVSLRVSAQGLCGRQFGGF